MDFDGIIITPGGKGVKSLCLTDTGASAQAFLNKKFIQQHKIPTVALARPYNLRLADDKLAPPITHMAQVRIELGGHKEELWCLVTSLGRFDLILGMPWLEQHDPKTSFNARSLTFDSEYCMANCLHQQRSATICSRGSSLTTKHDIAEISAYAFTKMAEGPDHQVIAMWPEHFEILDDPETKDIYMIGNQFTTDVAAITAEDYMKFFEEIKKAPLTKEQLMKRVPKEYHDYIEVWSPKEANRVPPRRHVDHRINL